MTQPDVSHPENPDVSHPENPDVSLTPPALTAPTDRTAP